ncbi:hypothetical protein [[Eubacterium] cellulosolvens]
MKRKLEIAISLLPLVLLFSALNSSEIVNASLATYSFTINYGESLDVDAGTAGTASSMDILNFGTPSSLLTQNGAAIALADSEDFDSVCDASQYTFDITSISTLNILVGDVYLIRTSLGNYAKFRVDDVSAPIVTITVVYQDDGSNGLCGTASQPVGGYVTPVEKFVLMMPYLALAGLIALISTFYIIKIRKK